jgi:hypothetical protein
MTHGVYGQLTDYKIKAKQWKSEVSPVLIKYRYSYMNTFNQAQSKGNNE